MERLNKAMLLVALGDGGKVLSIDHKTLIY